MLEVIKVKFAQVSGRQGCGSSGQQGSPVFHADLGQAVTSLTELAALQGLTPALPAKQTQSVFNLIKY